MEWSNCLCYTFYTCAFPALISQNVCHEKGLLVGLGGITEMVKFLNTLRQERVQSEAVSECVFL